jgi:lactoylglutathione lyase
MSQIQSLLGPIGRVIIPVRDQDVAIEFYVGTLGFEKIADERYGKDDEDRWVEVRPAGGETAIALGTAVGGRVGIPTGIAFRTSDADALNAELKALGVDADDILEGPGAPRLFFFRDADGNTLIAVEER